MNLKDDTRKSMRRLLVPKNVPNNDVPKNERLKWKSSYKHDWQDQHLI